MKLYKRPHAERIGTHSSSCHIYYHLYLSIRMILIEPYYLLVMYTECSVCFLQLTCYFTRVIMNTCVFNICPPNQTTKSMKEMEKIF